MSFSFGIIGGGWYGCHIASTFKSAGYDVTVFEAEDTLLSKASGNNQFRLHQGFHYARNYRTRIQSRDGYMRFVERYPTLSEAVSENIYAVPDKDSLIDFMTYRLIMSTSGIEFSDVNPDSYQLARCSGALRTDERVLQRHKARGLFRAKLSSCLRMGERVVSVKDGSNGIYVNGERYDYVIDATWGGMAKPNIPIHYEPTLLLYYRSISDLKSYALTMVDGDLCSVYPTDMDGVFTLSSVVHTPLGSFPSMKWAKNHLDQMTESVVESKRVLMEEQICKYMPAFHDHFEYMEPQFSIKTKIMGATDDRSCYVGKEGRRISVMSGKIDTIFYASESIMTMVESETELQVATV